MTDEQADTVVRIERGEQAVALIADQIEQLAAAADALRTSGLTDHALVVLLHDFTGLGKRDIRLVLDALPRLGYYLSEEEG